MENKSIYDEIFDKPCSVCGKFIKKDIYDQGNCPYCKWKNNFLADENPNNVVYPNLISLNKAKQLYIKGKPFEPNLLYIMVRVLKLNLSVKVKSIIILNFTIQKQEKFPFLKQKLTLKIMLKSKVDL